MAQQVWRCGVAAKIYVFNQQIRSDDGLFPGRIAKDCGVVSDTANKRLISCGCDALLE